MALLDDIKASLRVSSDLLNDEVDMLIDAALYDMERVGVDPTLLDRDDLDNAFVKQAVTAYCKANFGYDNPEAARFYDTYTRIVWSLMNSSANIAAKQPEAGNQSEAGNPAEGGGD